MNFVDLFLDYTKSYESPTSFWRWASYATIAATLRNHVYLKHRIGQFYPNIYVILVADSAESRKGAPFWLAGELLNNVKPTKVIQGRNSIQYVLEKLATDYGDKTTGVALKGGSGICMAEELAAFFVKDPNLSEILTDIYDFKPKHDIGLKSGSQSVKDLCFTLFAASNETFLRAVYDTRAVYGGLLRRTFIVKADEVREGKSFFKLSKLEEKDKKPLTESLTKIKNLRGPVQWTEEAEAFYDAWYLPLYQSYRKHKDKTGFIQGVHSLVIKLAIIIAASNYSLLITKEIMEEAISRTIDLKPNYEIYAMTQGKMNHTEVGGIILNEMFNAPEHKQTRKQILMNHWNDILAEDLDALMTTLEQAGMIVQMIDGRDQTYLLTARALEYFQPKKI